MFKLTSNTNKQHIISKYSNESLSDQNVFNYGMFFLKFSFIQDCEMIGDIDDSNEQKWWCFNQPK